MNYTELKKLDEKTLAKLTEGLGPSDECICSLLAPAEQQKKGFTQSIKKAFASISQGKQGKGQRKSKQERLDIGGNYVDVPLSFTKGGKGMYTTKEVVKRSSPCGKCGCDKENIVLKHSFANIRITTPDVSSICPCPSDCLPDKDKFQNDIKVTIERVELPDKIPAYSFEEQNTEEPGLQETLETSQSDNTVDQADAPV